MECHGFAIDLDRMREMQRQADERALAPLAVKFGGVRRFDPEPWLAKSTHRGIQG
jgi:hypothetical protein